MFSYSILFIGIPGGELRSIFGPNRFSRQPQPISPKHAQVFMTHFQFLAAEWADEFESASKAEALAILDPRTACFYARRALELAVHWAYKFDRALKLPYQDNVSARGRCEEGVRSHSGQSQLLGNRDS